jgi:hypothetical protein
MALLENGLKTTLGGLAIGVGVAVVAPIIVPILASIVKPLTKAVIKEGLVLYGKGRETAAEARETIEDLLAEAKSEIEAGSELAADTGAGAVASAAYAAEAGPATKKKPGKQPPRRRKTRSNVGNG